MWTFFRPWRRKVGIVTVVVACLFMGGWLRSDVIRDKIAFCPSYFWPQLPWYGEIVSLQGSLGWHRYEMDSDCGGIGTNSLVKLTSFNAKNYFACSPKIEDTLVWHSRWAGFGYGAGKTHLRGMSAQVWTIPYWSIVTPLTLISLWLLLSKPRISTQKKIPEPIPTDGK